MWSAPTPPRPSRGQASRPPLVPPQLPLAVGTFARGFVRSAVPPPERTWAAQRPGPGLPAGPTRWLLAARRRRGGLPGSWAARRARAPVSDPDGAGFRLDHRHPRCCLPLMSQRRPPQWFFRGSISRPMRFLCTLRYAGRPTHRNTRFRVVVSLPGWGSTHGAALRTSMSTSSSLLPGLAWRTTCQQPILRVIRSVWRRFETAGRVLDRRTPRIACRGAQDRGAMSGRPGPHGPGPPADPDLRNSRIRLLGITGSLVEAADHAAGGGRAAAGAVAATG